MLVLFGLRTKDRLVATRVQACEVCGQVAGQALVTRSTRFTLFFVPLFPVRPRRSFLDCGYCRTTRPVDAATAERFATAR